MIYRLTYKRVLITTQQIAMVEEDIVAETFRITESGGLILFGFPDKNELTWPIKGIPPGAWVGIEVAGPEPSSIIR